MPVTKSEMMFFAAGAAVGAAVGANFPLLKEKFGPVLAAGRASSAVSESYAEVAKQVAEKVEAVQDAMAEMKQAPPVAAPAKLPRFSLEPPTCIKLPSTHRLALRCGLGPFLSNPSTKRRASMDLAICFPTQGRIHLESRFLFSEPHEPNCRQFLERVFQGLRSPRSPSGVNSGRARFLKRSWVFVPGLTRSRKSSTG